MVSRPFWLEQQHMSDENAEPNKFERLKGEAQQTVDSLFAALREQVRSNAADMGEPISDDNAVYMGAISALAFVANINVTDPAIAHVGDLARTVAPRTRNAWSQAKAQLEWCRDNETVADAFPHTNPRNPSVADALMQRCPTFYHVHDLYAPLVAEATCEIMKMRENGWDELNVGWTNIYTLVVAAHRQSLQAVPVVTARGAGMHSIGAGALTWKTRFSRRHTPRKRQPSIPKTVTERASSRSASARCQRSARNSTRPT